MIKKKTNILDAVNKILASRDRNSQCNILAEKNVSSMNAEIVSILLIAMLPTRIVTAS